jgi:hypothetical protein
MKAQRGDTTVGAPGKRHSTVRVHLWERLPGPHERGNEADPQLRAADVDDWRNAWQAPLRNAATQDLRTYDGRAFSAPGTFRRQIRLSLEEMTAQNYGEEASAA